MNSLANIRCEGLPLEQFDALPSMKLWAESRVRRPNQHARKAYKKRKSSTKPALTNIESESEDEEEERDMESGEETNDCTGSETESDMQ